MRAYSPSELCSLKLKSLPFTSDWEYAFGKPEYTSNWFIYGASTCGKSSFAMQLSKYLCKYGKVLYVSYEEGVSLAIQRRMNLFNMNEVDGRFLLTSESYEDLKKRLLKKKQAHFIVIDSLQMSGWNKTQVINMIQDFPRKSFIFISQESNGKPKGAMAEDIKYKSDVKIHVMKYRAKCEGRFVGDVEAYFTIWEEGAAKYWLD